MARKNNRFQCPPSTGTKDHCPTGSRLDPYAYPTICFFQERVLLNLAQARLIKETAGQLAATAGHRTESPTPFMTIPRKISRYQRMGLSQVTYWTASGMFFMGNMKPESMTAGHEDEKAGRAWPVAGCGTAADNERNTHVAEKIEAGQEVKQGKTSMDPDVKDKKSHHKHDGHGDVTGNHIGKRFSQDELNLANGGDHDLFDGADLLLLDDADAGQKQAENKSITAIREGTK